LKMQRLLSQRSFLSMASPGNLWAMRTNKFAQARVFTTASLHHDEKFMKLDTGNLYLQLMERQRQFEESPTDLSKAYRYFRELNRHQKFQTVIRLYEKYETDYRTTQEYHLQDKVRDQY